MTKTGQKLIESAKEALAFAQGKPNDCVVYHVKPLFIPLKTESFNAFKDGTKTHELRIGAKWGHKQCKIGREVILSKGYGKHERLNGVINSFEVIKLGDLSNSYQCNLHKILFNKFIDEYGIDLEINKIGIKVLK